MCQLLQHKSRARKVRANLWSDEQMAVMVEIENCQQKVDAEQRGYAGAPAENMGNLLETMEEGQDTVPDDKAI